MNSIDLSTITKTFAGVLTVAIIVAVGAAKQAGFIDADTADLAFAALTFGGAGVAIGGALSKGSA